MKPVIKIAFALSFLISIFSCNSSKRLIKEKNEYNFTKNYYAIIGNGDLDSKIEGKYYVTYLVSNFLFANDSVKTRFVHRNTIPKRVNFFIQGITDTTNAKKIIAFAVMDSFNVVINDSIDFVDHYYIDKVDLTKLNVCEKFTDFMGVSKDGIQFQGKVNSFLWLIGSTLGIDVLYDFEEINSDVYYNISYKSRLLKTHGIEKFINYLKREFGITLVKSPEKKERFIRYIISD